METEQRKQILVKFEEVSKRLDRARLIYEVDIVRPETVVVSVYEIERVIAILNDLIKPIPCEQKTASADLSISLDDSDLPTR